MSRKTTLLAMCLFSGAASLASTGCTSLGPQMGPLAYPIPVSPFWQKTPEDKAWIHERYEKTPVLPPIPPGGPSVAIDPPSDDEVMRAMEEIDPVQGGMPLFHEEQRNNVRIVKEKIADFVDPPRVYPLCGPAQLHHSRWKCTVVYTRVTRPGWPIPQHIVDESEEVVYIDHDHLHMVGNVDDVGSGAPMPAVNGPM
jgi:hypothetical protein